MPRKAKPWITALCALALGAGASLPLAVQCQPSDTALCLNRSGFRVTASWRTAAGLTGQGHAVPLTADTGYFWFFNPANVEVLVKVIDGCALNQRFWVFAGGLTNVEVTLLVENGTPGRRGSRAERRTFVNPQGRPFQPIQSTDAFTCPAGRLPALTGVAPGLFSTPGPEAGAVPG